QHAPPSARTPLSSLSPHDALPISCEILTGEYLSIMGPSGSGKSTLFNMIGGLDKPNEGSVFVNSVDIAQLTPRELAFLRCHTIGDRKSTRLNSSHVKISYAVFCLK